jgi:hypothetical protein
MTTMQNLHNIQAELMEQVAIGAAKAEAGSEPESEPCGTIGE